MTTDRPHPPRPTGRPHRAIWLWPLVGLLLATALFRLTALDLTLAGRAFAREAGWASSEAGFWGWLYRLAPWPAILLGLASLAHLGASLRWASLRRHNRRAWCVLAALAVGPGLIVNATLKDHYGRPRPRQVEAFGGPYTYLPVLTPGPHRDARSFPSGHASIAFFLLTPFFFLRHRRLAWACLLAGLGWGLLVGGARVMQGGHWPSDVLWAGAIVYFTGYLASRAFGFRPGGAHATG